MVITAKKSICFPLLSAGTLVGYELVDADSDGWCVLPLHLSQHHLSLRHRGELEELAVGKVRATTDEPGGAPIAAPAALSPSSATPVLVPPPTPGSALPCPSSFMSATSWSRWPPPVFFLRSCRAFSVVRALRRGRTCDARVRSFDRSDRAIDLRALCFETRRKPRPTKTKRYGGRS